MGDKKEEFNWVNDISSDYWDYHNVLAFNDAISYEEFDDLISYALYSKSPKNSHQWDDDGKKEAWHYLTHLVKSYSVGYLIWDKPYLAVSAQVNKSLKNPKLVNYKDIVNQKPKLDESDEFSWVKDEIDRPIRFSVGDKIRVINVGDVQTFIDFLGTVGVYYRKGLLGPTIEGEIIDGGNEHLFPIREKTRGKIIFLPWLDMVDYWSESFPNLDVKYEFIDDELNESSDFGWIEDTNPKELESPYDFILEYFTKNTNNTYKGYEYGLDNFTGTVKWVPTKEGVLDFYIYATPFWAEAYSLPIDFVDADGNLETRDDIEVPKFKYEMELVDWLENEYPKIVYKQIEEFSSEVITENTPSTQLTDDELNESSDLDWIKDVEPPDLNFSFDGREHWVDVSKIDREGRKKIVNYIKKTVPNYEEFENDLFGHISRGNYKGIIIHCGSDRTDYEPEENLLCSANSSYEDDYKIDNPYSDMIKSVYLDGQEILDYITVVDNGDEELDESLEWSDKDVPFDEKDKSFESDPSWKDDEDWSLNPERSYWKQGDTGGSGGGDVNESNELEWISNTRPTLKDVFDENLIEVGDILTLSGVLLDDDHLNNQWVEDFKVKIGSVSHKGGLSSTYFTPLQKKYWDFLGYDGTGDVRFVKKDGDLQLVGRINSKDVVEESNDWDWVEDIPGTKEFGQKYRYFEILTCYSIDYESEECDDEHSHFVKIPKHEADEFWVDEVIGDLDMDILAGPVDDGEGVIMYAIQNRLISHFDINEIIMFEGVRELDKNTYDKLTNYRDSEMVESNDFDWVKDVKPNWGTYYGGIIMKDIEGLPKNLEDVTSEMLSPIWMKIETINRQILTRKNRDAEHGVSETLFESMGQIEWLFGRIMALVDGETASLVSSRMEPQEYYNSRKLTIISHIKGMAQQLELLGESNDFDWVEDVTPRMDATLLKPGQKFYDKWGDVIRVLEYLGGSHGEGEVCYKPPCSLLRFRKIKDPSGYRIIPGLPADDPQNTDMIMIPRDFDEHIESGKLKLVSKRTMYESKDFKWVEDSNDFKLDKNKNYVLDVSDLDLSNVEVHPRSRFSKREVLLDEILENLSEMGYDTNVVREEVLRGLDIHYLYLTKCRYSGNLKVEYDGDFVEDITYGGQYEVVDNVEDFIFMIKNKIVKESKDFDWVKDIEPDKRESKYYIIDKRSFSEVPEKQKDQWFMIEILENDKYGIHWRPYAWNLVNVHTWNPTHKVNKMSNDEFKNLLGLGSNNNPYWYPHDGDLSDLPKNYDHGLLSQLNTPKNLRESDDVSHFNWVKKISSDDYEPRTGDHIEIVNQGDSHLFKNWLSPTIWMDYNMGKITNSDGNIEGVVQNNYPVQNAQDNFVVKIKGTKHEYIFLPKRYKIKQIKEKIRDPEWHGLDIVYRPIELRSELKEDSSDSTDWDWAKKIEPKYTKIAPNIYQYGSGSLPRIKVVFKRVVDGEIKTTAIEFDDYEFLDSEEYMNRHFILMGVDDEDNDWIVDGIAYLIGGGEYEWDVNWDSIENNG